MGIGDWGLGIGPKPQIPNPQSPIPMKIVILIILDLKNLYNNNIILNYFEYINIINFYLFFFIFDLETSEIFIPFHILFNRFLINAWFYSD